MSDQQRPKFGNRFLTEESDVYSHNAWDNFSWNEELQEDAKLKVLQNSKQIIPITDQEKYELDAEKYWNDFYKTHKTGFFKDRHWLFTEFPELCNKITESEKDYVTSTHIISHNSQNAPKTILEIGCGAGNSVFPLMEASQEGELFIYCCDFSEVAVSLVKDHPEFNPNKCHAFVLDITSDSWNVPFSENSIDCILLVFVLSALHPDKMQNAVNNLVRYLKPGGKICFRDYGQFDMAELRFKPGHCLGDHYYVRGDGTKVFFFSESQVHELFTNAGLNKIENKSDRRLQVNRGRLLKMYRIWIQAIYEKPLIQKSESL